jgi:hypothetical protein
MVRSRINKSRYLLNTNRVSKRKKFMLKGGEIIRYSDGSVYDGELIDGKKNGKGKLTRVNDDIYDGEWKDDMWNGKGVFSTKKGSVYDGHWKDNKRNGRGKQTWADGEFYDGEWKDDKRNGRGKQTWADGKFYDGEWKDDKKEGKGELTRVNHDIYDGEWKDDMWNGKGVFSTNQGFVYDGHWKNNKREGMGKQTYSNAIYEGNWKDGRKHGKGKINYSYGDIYDGEWEDDMWNGKGVFSQNIGLIYDGEWKKNQREGIGYQTYFNGEEYNGQWKDDKKEGIGNFRFSNGNVYNGEWKDNKKHGQGVLYLDQCGIMQGEYINNLQEGRHTHFSCDWKKIIKYYYYNHGKMFTFENNIDKYIISEQSGDIQNRYITLLINLHGSDVINSICRLARNKHVRCISPVKCGQSVINDPRSIIDAFLIAYNISHLQHNRNASTYEKIMKIIEVYNQSNTDFYDLNDGAFSRPLIDHYYLAYPIDDVFTQICIIDTNHLIDIFRDSYDLFSQKNMDLKIFEDIEQYNILLKLRPLLNINSKNLFLRSNLINVLLDLGYDTINIIDFSCRLFNMDNLTDLYSSLQSKDFVCNYIENTNEHIQMGDVIGSRNK